jgi:uncharacterized phage protein (TIGR02218 family)
MRTIPSGLQTHIEQEVATVAHLVKLTRLDSEVFGFTDHDRDLIVDGITYSASSAFDASQVTGAANLSSDNLNIIGALDSAAITVEGLERGDWDGCEFEVMKVNWANVSQGTYTLRRGHLGRVKRVDNALVVEALGLIDRVQRTVGRSLLPTCDVKRLGDARCTKSLASFTHTGTVTVVTDARTTFTCGAPISSQAAGYFRRGTVLFNTGANAGLEFNVYENASAGVLILDNDAPHDIAVGDSVTAVAGCDRTMATCRDTFDNLVNFRGFPYVPGRDKLIGEPVQ